MFSIYLVDCLVVKGLLDGFFYFKEFSIYDLDKHTKQNFILNIPKTVPYEEVPVKELVEKALICQNEERVYKTIREAMCAKFQPKKCFYAWGAKSEFLQQIMRLPVYDLRLFGCPSTEVLIKSADDSVMTTCRFHQERRFICPRMNTRCLADWSLRFRDRLEFKHIVNRLLTFVGWECTDDPRSLAEIGFIRSNNGSGVICVYCHFQCDKVKYVKDVIFDHSSVFYLIKHYKNLE